jgi:hypothetical protein
VPTLFVGGFVHADGSPAGNEHVHGARANQRPTSRRRARSPSALSDTHRKTSDFDTHKTCFVFFFFPSPTTKEVVALALRVWKICKPRGAALWWWWSVDSVHHRTIVVPPPTPVSRLCRSSHSLVVSHHTSLVHRPSIYPLDWTLQVICLSDLANDFINPHDSVGP